MSYSPWGRKELDTTERLTHAHTYIYPLSLERPYYPSRSSQSTKLSSVLHSRFPLYICFTCDSVYVSNLVSQFISPSFSPPVPAHVCALCLHLQSWQDILILLSQESTLDVLPTKSRINMVAKRYTFFKKLHEYADRISNLVPGGKKIFSERYL